MRKNLPVTDNERTFNPGERLVSTTDLKGRITHCNDAFVAISGFTRDELLGQPHNIVRHPDMPPEAFEVMWEHLKAGQPWMGLVKNRAKNGDFYWVDAYVTPITDNGEIVGYESVRSEPSREDVRRADTLYRRIRQGRGGRRLPVPGPDTVGATGVLASGVVLATAGVVPGAVTFGGVGLVYALMSRMQAARMVRALHEQLPNAFRHPLAVASYTNETGWLGRLKVAIKSEQARMVTVLTRIEDASRRVNHQSGVGLDHSTQAKDEIARQQTETEQVAAAMHEMSTTISEVSRHVQRTADKSGRSAELVDAGRELSARTRESIVDLQGTVNAIGDAVEGVSRQTGEIAEAAGLIDQIADQTNLLALNAAIEAARAGEHGRGFAVVAEEVRHLARRTQDSTRDIHQIIAGLTEQAQASVAVAQRGREAATAGVERVHESEEMLDGIAEAVDSIRDMATSMAAAVEQQATVSGQVDQQVQNISSLAGSSLDLSATANHKIHELERIAVELHELVSRFKRN
ncbi:MULTISPECIES: PAS domain-containing methyl-accepting chemotaxis protein [unclassified Guyparkeria]|uniref:methyl-accepting chemotaxis protein n=1 Tax=unclassified Guyparkeria TaxID=2626246 RepID=UPI0007339EF2|nr:MULTISPECIES: PAS domain-containing methyl-accepting chemotaxis protein [unclassified Guyparkeria]KTG16207.1 chemotaxis protein [Guyparkeria sp. XI15]OAE85058.1 chemotaxis protein [Guyparkeria sp. WRN-7]